MERRKRETLVEITELETVEVVRREMGVLHRYSFPLSLKTLATILALLPSTLQV